MFVKSDGLPAALSGAVALFAENSRGESHFGLYVSKKPVAGISIGANGETRNVTIFDHPADQAGIPVAFGYCTTELSTLPDIVNREGPDFLNPKRWVSGCGYVSNTQPGIVRFHRETSMADGKVRIFQELPNIGEMTSQGGSSVAKISSGKFGINIVVARLIDDQDGKTRGVLVTYADPNRMLATELVRLQRHRQATGDLYGICSATVHQVDGMTGIGD